MGQCSSEERPQHKTFKYSETSSVTSRKTVSSVRSMKGPHRKLTKQKSEKEVLSEIFDEYDHDKDGFLNEIELK